MEEDDIQLILKQYISCFTTYESSPGIYSIKDISEVLSGFQIEIELRGRIRPTVKQYKSDSIIKECDDFTMRTKLTVKGDIQALRFDQNSFFSSILGLSPHWVYERDDKFFPGKI